MRRTKNIEDRTTGNGMPDRLASLEQRKRGKLAAIRAAAQHAFAEKGFDAATMQEIARRAHVAIGTLFLYADNKRDIAFLAMMEDFDRAKAAGAALPTTPPLLDQYVGMFGEYYRLHHESPAMARVILSEFLFFHTGKHARLHGEGVLLLKAELARRAEIARARGELSAGAVPSEVAELAYYIFQGAVRQWVRSGADDLGEGLAAFRHMMALSLTGVAAAPLVSATRRPGHRSAGAKASTTAPSAP